MIRLDNGRHLLSDQNSANGTFVNDRPARDAQELRPGDRIRFANNEWTFKVPTAAPTPIDAGPQFGDSQIFQLSGTWGGLPSVQGELRLVTILFADLKGFTALSETMSPDKVALLMNQCFERLTRVTTYYGGYVDKYVGDAMMVLFGAPVADEDDAERAVRAAIGMQDELERYSFKIRRPRLGIELKMRVGINTGEVLAAALAPASSRPSRSWGTR